ncbi:MAG: putative toxin-antitoxin system toxin component, PIN family [Prevotellaceae bacterium]|nr:putative toxin-antitoxin system toxin component, PIN family [Prevotellaceae bacterium]
MKHDGRLVVLDTNCLLQAISKRSPYRPIWNAFLQRDFCLCVSNEILEEYQEIIEEQTLPSIAENIVMLLVNAENVKFVNPQYRFGLIEKDVDDNKFVDCAIVCSADFIVSDDTHFDVLRDIPFPKVRVRKLDDFLQDFI